MADSSPVPGPASDCPDADMLTPRSKVAKMLADIDNAPSPSPPTRRSPLDTVRRSHTTHTSQGVDSHDLDAREPSRQVPVRAQNGPFQTESMADSDSDDLDAIRQPLGRAARRMLVQQQTTSAKSAPPSRLRSSPPDQHVLASAESDEDLYSATPLKSKTASRLMSGSPMGSDAGGLFVSPAKSGNAGSDNELPSNPFGSKEKLAELVTQKREERLRREAEERQQTRSLSPTSGAQSKHKRKEQRSGHASSDLLEEALEDSQVAANPDFERLMSDAARPTRKASKRALLEMERETQRLSRQQALAHQMKVKKKFTTSDLMAKFNVSRPQLPEQTATGGVITSSAPNSDGVDGSVREPVSTPPSSPPTAGPTPLDKQKAMVERGALSKLIPMREDSIASLAQIDSDEDLPDIADVLSPAREHTRLVSDPPAQVEDEQRDKRGLKLARLGKKAVIRQYDNSSDSELEIVDPLPRHLQVFDRIRPRGKQTSAADHKAVHILKHLSHIGAYDIKPNRPGKGPSRPSIGSKTLETQLRRKAKEQARLQQQERVADLKAKGIDVQTMEEREREAEVFESLLEKARMDAVELRKIEKAAAKEAAGDQGAPVEISEDEEEDDDYVASGSEEGAGEAAGEGLVDAAAEESEEDDIEMTDEEEVGETGTEQVDHPEEAPRDELASPAVAARKPRQSRVIRDEDDDEIDPMMGDENVLSRDGTTVDDEDPFAAFNFGANIVKAAFLSPTQAFKATMQMPTQATQEDSFDILRHIAPPSAVSLPPSFPSDGNETQQVESQVSIVPGSQVPESQRMDLNWDMQAPETPRVAGTASLASNMLETPGWEPTQDPGLPSPWTAGLRRESTVESMAEDHETQSTVLIDFNGTPASGAAHIKRGRLMRRQAALPAESSDDEEADAAASRAQEKKDAFREMARRRAAALTTSERAEAAQEMKAMLEEQAEESEDEYAGLGGDDFVAPETEEDKAMIDSGHVEVDERAIASHFAEKQRLADEAATSKLFKDLTTGALRRKQANAFDLEEDEDEVAMRRRAMKQREEARKRKLLLQDDNIAGLAQGRQSKGKDAFLKAIADDDDGDGEMFDLSDGGEEETQASTQDESQMSQTQAPVATALPEPLREVSGKKRRLDDGEEEVGDRQPAKQRRTQASAFRKPVSMMEVSESISFLLDETDPGLAAASLDLASDSEDDAYGSDPEISGNEDDIDLDAQELARANDGGFAPNSTDFDARAMPPPPPPRLPASQRRTATTSQTAVVDRLSLKRSSSTSLARNANSRTAWASPILGGGPKAAPSLLRRATTKLSAGNDRGVSTPNLSREGSSGSGVKMGGSKKSSLAYQARAEERKVIVEAGMREREAGRRRVAELRRSQVGMLGTGLGGTFE